MALKRRFYPALTDWMPYEDPDDPEFPSYAEYSMMGTCPQHGLERITDRRVGGGSDPTELYILACGEVDLASFGPTPERM